MSARRLAVTGASGFVGRHVVQAALADGWEVTALTRDPARWPSALAGERLRVVQWDIAGAATQPAAFEGAQALCHAAAHIPADYGDPAEARACFLANAVGTVDVLEAAVAAGVSTAVVLSSANAYAPTATLARETDPLYPNHRAPYYLASKAASDSVADSYRTSGRLRCTVLRLPAVYGPGMARSGFLWTCLDRLGRGVPIDLADGGRHRVDWAFAPDVAQAVLAAFDAETEGPVNLGSGREMTVLDVARHVAEVLGAPDDLIRVGAAAGSPPVGFATLDIEKARRVLAYAPTPFPDGVRALCAALGLPSQARRP